MSTLTGFLWFFVYVHNIYEHDRHETLDRWQKDFEATDMDNCDKLLFGMLKKSKFLNYNLQPDICIVFHHPSHEKHTDMDDIATPAFMDHVLLHRDDPHKKEFARFASLVDQGENSPVAKDPSLS